MEVPGECKISWDAHHPLKSGHDLLAPPSLSPCDAQAARSTHTCVQLCKGKPNLRHGCPLGMNICYWSHLSRAILGMDQQMQHLSELQGASCPWPARCHAVVSGLVCDRKSVSQHWPRLWQQHSWPSSPVPPLCFADAPCIGRLALLGSDGLVCPRTRAQCFVERHFALCTPPLMVKVTAKHEASIEELQLSNLFFRSSAFVIGESTQRFANDQWEDLSSRSCHVMPIVCARISCCTWTTQAHGPMPGTTPLYSQVFVYGCREPIPTLQEMVLLKGSGCTCGSCRFPF